MTDPEQMIDDLIDVWHTAPNDSPIAGLSLPAFLGMTDDQYARWVMQKMPAAELAAWAATRSAA